MVSGWWGVLVAVVAAGCARQGPQVRSGEAPEPDGDRVISYDVDVLEDDSRCGARVPYKESKEVLIAQWHTDRDVTLYARGGLFETDVSLDDANRYRYDGTGGPCIPGSWVDGWLNKQEGEATLYCRKVDCEVYIYNKARRSVPDAGPPTP